MSEELKPCPFCGKAGALTTLVNYWKVACISCRSEGPSSVNREYAVEWWNARPAPVQVPEGYPDGFDASCGIPAEAMRAANALLADMKGIREWDVPCAAAHIAQFSAPAAPAVDADRFSGWQPNMVYGDEPADDRAYVEVLLRSGDTMRGYAGDFYWNHSMADDDIMKWRELTPAIAEKEQK